MDKQTELKEAAELSQSASSNLLYVWRLYWPALLCGFFCCGMAIYYSLLPLDSPDGLGFNRIAQAYEYYQTSLMWASWALYGSMALFFWRSRKLFNV